MSRTALAAAAPAAAAVRPVRAARRGQQTVWVPERLFVGAHYCDEAVMVWVKVAALDARRRWSGTPCTASVSELAGFLGISKSAVERGLAQLRHQGPDGGAPEIATKRQTHRGGAGKTAERRVRPVLVREPAYEVRVAAAEALSPRQLRAHLQLLRSQAVRLRLTAAELAGELHHHTGTKAGQPLDERTARRLIDELERFGWITVDRRAGYQGRHLITVHDSPLHAVEDQPAVVIAAAGEAPGPDIHDGSGPGDHDGSLASKEDPPAVIDAARGVDGSIRRRRGDRSRPVDTDGSRVPETFSTGHRVLRTDPPSPSRTTYTGPGLQLSPRTWHILAPVRHLLPAIPAYELRQIARAIGAQLDDGTAPARLTARLRLRYASTVQAPRRGWGRWILGAGLPRRGCGLTGCESGVIWHTGHACQVCADLRHLTTPGPAAARPPEPAPPPALRPARPPTWCACPGCRPAPDLPRPA